MEEKINKEEDFYIVLQGSNIFLEEFTNFK